MRFRIRYANQIVGGFVIIALVFAVVLVVVVGSGQGWFEPRYEYRTELTTAQGLNLGMTVDFRGFEVGRVTDITLNEENMVDVTFYIRDRFRHLVREGSLVELAANPLLGGTLVLHQGTRSSEPLEELSVVPEWNSAAGRQTRTAGAVQRSQPRDQISSLLEQVDPLVENLGAVLSSTDSVLQTVDATLAGRMTEGPIAETVNRINTLMATVERRLAETEPLLAGGDELLRSANIIAANAAIASGELTDLTGIVPRVLDPSGSLATFLDDDNRLFHEVEALLLSLNSSLDELAGLAAFAGAQTPQLAAILEEGREALLVGQDVLIGLRNNPLLRGGIPDRIEQPTNFESFREADF